ncbi:MAG: hypothetical protein KDA91_11065 [Planctomycetaceae bacterium]|nr:hypothetical protein [Planctomycetaceae bacterium]
MSFLLPVALLAMGWRLQSLTLGLIAGVILLASLILHELGHLAAARLTGGDAENILLWPLGGLRPVLPGPGNRAAIIAHLAGILVNVVVLAFLISPLQQAQRLDELLNPFGGFDVFDGDSLELTAWRMAFYINWCLIVFNLVPVLPMDGGNLLQWFLELRYSRVETRDLLIRIGLVASLFGLLVGFVFDVSGVVALSAVVLIMHLHEAMQVQRMPMPTRDESFMGYDFSEGYTSLDRSSSEWSPVDSNPSLDDNDQMTEAGLLERWKARRAEERQRRESEEHERDEKRMDSILEKLHQHGREALSTEELQILDRVSRRLRERNV